MTNEDDLLDRLRTEADLCRNETATDVADLLDHAADKIERLADAISTAYGHLWHANEVTIPRYHYPLAMKYARKALMATMTQTERRSAIEAVSKQLSPNAN